MLIEPELPETLISPTLVALNDPTLPETLILLETSPLTLIYPFTAPTLISPTLPETLILLETSPLTSILFIFPELIPYITTVSSLV